MYSFSFIFFVFGGGGRGGWCFGGCYATIALAADKPLNLEDALRTLPGLAKKWQESQHTDGAPWHAYHDVSELIGIDCYAADLRS